MANGYTIFTSYFFKPKGQSTKGAGFGQAIHCNYIKPILVTTDPYSEEVRVSFSNSNDFKFLSSTISGGTGYTASEFNILVQLVANSGFTKISDVKPNPALWKIVNVTNQISDYTVAAYTAGTFFIKPTGLTTTVFKVPMLNYNSYPFYNLQYLNYPTSVSGFSFGAETFFLGNVYTEIHADVYTTNLSLVLNLNEFNSSTNSTWDRISRVAITEIGIYDANKNLVAIGKLNDPLEKDDTIGRTIAFAIDF